MTPWIHAIGTRSALAALCGALFLGAGSIALRRWRPAAIVAGGATLEQLRIDAMTLRSNDDASAAAAVERRRQLEAELWTEAALSKWKTSLPPL